MKDWNPNVYPPDGWYYPVDGITLKGNSLDDLVLVLDRYLTQRNTSPGIDKVREMIVEFTCNRFSSGCRDSARVTLPIPPDVLSRAQGYAYQFYLDKKADKISFVSEELVTQRNKTCLECPYFKDNFGGGCTGCSEQLTKFVDNTGGDIPGFDSKVVCCSFFKVPANLYATTIKPPVSNAPEHCWLKSK